MQDNYMSEELIRFSEGRQLPLNPSRDKLERWAKIGLKSKKHPHTRIVLDTVMVGSEPCTSVEAFARFCRECSEEGCYVV